MQESIFEALAAEAIAAGADTLEVEYKDGIQEVYAMGGNVGYSIALLPSSGPEATALCSALP